MTIAEYENRGISIESLPLERLRGIDIKNVEEERRVQILVNQKLQRIPVPVMLKLPVCAVPGEVVWSAMADPADAE